MCKRLFDIFLSLTSLLILTPILIFIAIVIRIDSKGSILYRSNRIGLNEKVFVFYKFRSMNPGADKSGSITIGDNDSRITKIGYILRKSKLDELPQLLNVLIGDMSFVGPRPDVPKYIQFYNQTFNDYYKMKPGITSYSSIYFANESELYTGVEDPEKIYIEYTIPKKVELDKLYLNNMNVVSDIKLIILTLLRIIKS
jgi:lipopolysaccharide/colanic/teichoic acid biosynthesis glycosyltransferase